MQLSEFDFPFDPELVASQPVLPRDRARLLVLDRSTGELAHRHVSDLPSLLDPGDLLVVNDTRVMAARVAGRKQPGGTPVQVLFIKDLGGNLWDVMVKGKYRVGHLIRFGPQTTGTIVKRDATGTQVRMESDRPVPELFLEQGEMPLPPYIKRAPVPDDRQWYQTPFATREGAIAAPTAGLHFTLPLIPLERNCEMSGNVFPAGCLGRHIDTVYGDCAWLKVRRCGASVEGNRRNSLIRCTICGDLNREC